MKLLAPKLRAYMADKAELVEPVEPVNLILRLSLYPQVFLVVDSPYDPFVRPIITEPLAKYTPRGGTKMGWLIAQIYALRTVMQEYTSYPANEHYGLPSEELKPTLTQSLCKTQLRSIISGEVQPPVSLYIPHWPNMPLGVGWAGNYRKVTGNHSEPKFIEDLVVIALH